MLRSDLFTYLFARLSICILMSWAMICVRGVRALCRETRDTSNAIQAHVHHGWYSG